jgi:hypothetical protein
VFLNLAQALLGTVAYLLLALAIEMVTPLYRVSWKSRLLGLQFTLAKAVGVGLLVPVMNAGWRILGVQPIHLGSFADTIPGTIAAVALTVVLYDFLIY